MKHILILLFFPTFLFSQKIDTIIHTKIYTSYFSYELKEPVYVSYKLYKGGGDCSRNKYHFKNDTKIKMNSDKEYSGSGTDRGHLLDFENMAFNCEYGELTFRYYNCLPQYPNLNRGLWKEYENIMRYDSQTDSLLVVCGGSNFKLINKLYVPKYCWKVVYSLTTKELKYCLLFTNNKVSNVVYKLKSIEELENRIGFKILF